TTRPPRQRPPSRDADNLFLPTSPQLLVACQNSADVRRARRTRFWRRNRLPCVRPVVYSLLAFLGLPGQHRPSSTEWDEVLAKDTTEFGKVVKIQEAEGQIITDYHVCPTRVPDK